MNNSDRLNYCLKNASTHATIIVAVVFGLFSILGLMGNIRDNNSFWSNFLLNSVYFLLLVFGCYNVDRWKFFRSKALNYMKEITPEWKDYYWKNKRWIGANKLVFDIAILAFYVMGFITWFAVALSLFSIEAILSGFVLYIVSGTILGIFTLASMSRS